MLNINEQRIQEIKEGSKLLEENCRLICDSKLHLKLSKECKNLDFTSSAKLFDYAQYIYYNGDLLKGQKVGNKYYYHCVKTGDFLEEYTQAKRPIKDKYSNRTNFTNNRYCVNLVTGLPMNTISKIDGLSLCDWDNRFDIDKSISINKSTYTHYAYINHNVLEKVSNSSRVSPYEIYNSKGKNKPISDLKELVQQSLEEYGFIEEPDFDIYNLKPKSVYNLTSTHVDANFKVVYNPKNDRFYIKPNSEYLYSSYSAYSIEPKVEGELKYFCIDSDFFYLEDGDVKYILLNTEYTQQIQGYNIRYKENHGVEFLEQPYSSYFRLDGDLLIYKNNSLDINTIQASKKCIETASIITESNLEIIDKLDDMDVIPVTLREEGRKTVVYIAANDQGFYIYLYPGQNYATKNILTVPKYLKLARKNTSIFVHKNMICLSIGNGDFHTIDASEFDLSTLRVLSPTQFLITGKDGYDYISSRYKLVKLELPYDSYDYVHVSDLYHSNLITILNGKVEINGHHIYQKDESTVIIQRDDKEDVVLDHTTIEISEDNKVYLNTNYPHKVLEGHNKLYSSYDINLDRFNTNESNSKIKIENDNIVIYMLVDNQSVNALGYGKSVYYAYSKLTRECITLKKFQPSYDFSETYKATFSKDVFTLLPGYIYIHGHFVKDDMFNRFGNMKDKMLKVIEKQLLEGDYNIESYSDAVEIINESIYNCLISIAQEFEIELTKEDLINCHSPKDLQLILTSLSNINGFLTHSSYTEIFKEIENSVKGKDTLQSELFAKKHEYNDMSFKANGLSLEKFNNFDTVINFKASSGDNNGLKDSLCTDMYSQLEILLGSRRQGKKGFLQLDSLETISSFNSMHLNSKLDTKLFLTDADGNELEEKVLVKEINKLGFKYFHFLKKHNITFDLIDYSLIICGKNCRNHKLKKIIGIAKDMADITNKVQNEIEKNPIFNKFLQVALTRFLNWSIEHIQSSLSNISDEVNLLDDKEEELTIKLWDRHNILEALTQGSKTHCCLAVNSFNIGRLVEYIYNENINLVEIRNKNGVIGQAFVSIYKTNSKFHYRYEEKHHLFMIIDNVEINNSYSMYRDDIARNLQKFMNLYMLHTSDKISDVFLGASMNDIRPPYEFKQNIPVHLIGERGLYLDHSNTFYKFI